MKKLLLLIAIFTSVFALSTPVFAYRTLNQKDTLLAQAVDPTGIKKEDLQTKIGSLIKGALTLTGTVFFGLMFYAGFLWMTAKGEEEPITKAKSTLLAAIIGLAIIVSAYAITNIVTKLSQSASSSGGASGGAGAGGSGAAGSSNANFNTLQNQTGLCNDTLNTCINACTIDLDQRVSSCNYNCERIDPNKVDAQGVNEKTACLDVCNALYDVSAACTEGCQTVATNCQNTVNAQYEENQAQETANQCENIQVECRLSCRSQFPDTLAEQNNCINQCDNFYHLCVQ